MVYNKYLEELNVDTYFTNFTSNDDSRIPEWEKEREQYGFDNRETWCLDRIFAEWLYSRLRMYQDTEGEKLTECYFIYNETQYSFDEMIVDILLKTKFFIETDMWTKEEGLAINAMKEAIAMFILIFPLLWIQKDLPSVDVLEQQKRDYTFDEREVYRLYDTFEQWISSRIEMFDRVKNINTGYHKFLIDKKTMTQQECMDDILFLCEKYRKNRDMSCLIQVLNIWKEIFPCMWW